MKDILICFLVAIVVYLIVMKNVSWAGGAKTTTPPPPPPCTVTGWTDGPCVASSPCSKNGTKTQTATFNTANCKAQTQTASCNNAPACAPCTQIGWSNTGSCVTQTQACGPVGYQTQKAVYNSGGSCPTSSQTVPCTAIQCPNINNQSSLFSNNTTKAPINTLGPDGRTPWIWAQGGTPYFNYNGWYSTTWPVLNNQPSVFISSGSGYALSFLTATGQLCMWKYNFNMSTNSPVWTPVWWTKPGSTTSLPTLGSDGTISCQGLSWKWKPASTKAKGPFSLTISTSGSIIIGDNQNNPVQMTPAWPTSGVY